MLGQQQTASPTRTTAVSGTMINEDTMDISSESSDSEYEFQFELLTLLSEKRIHRCWVESYTRNREEHGEFKKVITELDNQQFKTHFKMSREQFYQLHELIRDDIKKARTNFRKPVRTDEMLAVCLRYFVTGDAFTTLAYKYKLGKTTVSNIVGKVSEALWKQLKPKYMKDPTKELWLNIAKQFEVLCQFSHCIGAIGGKLITIRSPGSVVFSGKHLHPVALFVVADANYNFSLIDVECLKSHEDSEVFHSSSLYQQLEQRTLNLPLKQPLTEGNIQVPYVFVGSDSFPLTESIMTLFPSTQAGEHDAVAFYNFQLSRVQQLVERSFGMLAARWHIYQHPFEVKPEKVVKILKATCILHNYLLQTSALTDLDFKFVSNGSEQLLPLVLTEKPVSKAASMVRNELVEHFHTLMKATPLQLT